MTHSFKSMWQIVRFVTNVLSIVMENGSGNWITTHQFL